MTAVSEASDPEIRKQIAKGKRRAIVPIGSIEQHGAHMPVATDAIIAEEIARRVSKLVEAFVLPPVFYGVSYEHKPLFNVSIGNETLASLISDICVSLTENGFDKIILMNAHYGNEAILSTIAQEIYNKIPKGTLIYNLSYWMVMDDEIGHADASETSLMLAIQPELVSMKSVKSGNTFRRIKSEKKVVLSRLAVIPSSVPKLTSSGIWGRDPRKANRRRGKIMLNQVIRKLADSIKDIEEVYGTLFESRK
ncbi:MAG: creatininase family protein [Nitrososphaerales archaeon]